MAFEMRYLKAVKNQNQKPKPKTKRKKPR